MDPSGVVEVMTQEDITAKVTMALIAISGTIITFVGFIWKIAQQRAADLKSIEDGYKKYTDECFATLKATTDKLWDKYDRLAHEVNEIDDRHTEANAARRRDLRKSLEDKIEKAMGEVKATIAHVDNKHSSNVSNIFNKIEDTNKDMKNVQQQQKDDVITLMDRIVEVWKSIGQLTPSSLDRK